MKAWVAISLAVAGTTTAASPPPPPIRVDPAAPHAASNDRSLLMWHAGEARCDGGVAVPVRLQRPLNQLVWDRAPRPEAVTYAFEIDPRGRTHSIARLDQDGRRFAEDVAPALAASRFASGGARTGCTSTFIPQTVPVAVAPVPELMSYSMNRDAPRLPREGWERIETGGDCAKRPRAAPLLQAFPDFDSIPATPGARDWAMVGYDLDAAGVPFGEQVVTGTGNIALDRASLKAVSDSRFAKGPRTGCLYPYWLTPAVLEAPPMPSRDAPDMVENPLCGERAGFANPPRLVFPEPYRRRSIEGWAIVRYDVAPWGEIGNVEVIEAQPSEDFGSQAVQMMRTAKAHTSGAGMTGCVDRVRFEMSKHARRTPDDDRPITIY